MKLRVGTVLILFLVPMVGASFLSGGVETEPAWLILTVDARSPFITRVVTNFTGQGGQGIVVHKVGDEAWDDISMLGTWHGATYEATSTPTGVVYHTPTEPTGFGLQLTTGFTPGRYRVLLWSVGHFPSFEWSFDPADGAIASVERGTSALFLDGTEAAEGIHAHAAASGYGASLSRATYGVDIEHEFLGIAGHQQRSYVSLVPLDPTSTITHTAPTGDTETCPCFASDVLTWKAGTHVLRWEGADAYGYLGQPLLLAGVDAPFHDP